MKTEEYVNIIRNMQEFSNLVECVYPDQYKFVCQQHDIPEREAMDMYGYLRKVASGQYWCIREKSDGYIYTMVGMAQEAQKLQMLNSLIKNTSAIGEDRKSNILAIFKKGDKYVQQEFDLQWQATFIEIAEMIKNGYILTTTARQVDDVEAKDYVGENKDKKSYIPIYDGDVMLCFVSKPEWWSSDCKKSGLYLCKNGIYHRLIYTNGKGYVRHGEPDTDEDFELAIDENAFSSYVMTLSQKWYKLGNIHAGIGFLIEKPKEKKKRMKKKVLTLTVSKQWFDMIVAGEKKEEYREIKPYWIKRLTTNCEVPYDVAAETNCGEVLYRPYTHVLFINGYRKDSPRIEKEIESITIGKPKKGLCPDKWLYTEFFIIKFK